MSLVWLPWALIAFRFLIGPILLFACLDGQSGLWIAVGLAAGIFSDIVDGFVARRVGSFSPRLRVIDSRVDFFFFLCVAAAAWAAHAVALVPHLPWIAIMLVIYAISLLYPYLKFGRAPAYHAYSAKAAGLGLFAAGAWLFTTGEASWLLQAAIIVAILSHLDRIAITFLISDWRTDVIGFWAARS